MNYKNISFGNWKESAIGRFFVEIPRPLRHWFFAILFGFFLFIFVILHLLTQTSAPQEASDTRKINLPTQKNNKNTNFEILKIYQNRENMWGKDLIFNKVNLRDPSIDYFVKAVIKEKTGVGASADFKIQPPAQDLSFPNSEEL